MPADDLNDRTIFLARQAHSHKRVKQAHTVIASGEPRLYANAIVRQDVIYLRGGTA